MLRSARSGALYCSCRLAGYGLDSTFVGYPAVDEWTFRLLLLLLLPCTAFLPSSDVRSQHLPVCLLLSVSRSLALARLEALTPATVSAGAPYTLQHITYSLIRLDAGRNSEIGTTESRRLKRKKSK
jgi:hypothetical protein